MSDLAAALDVLTHYVEEAGQPLAPPRFHARAALALVTQALGDARAQAIAECAVIADRKATAERQSGRRLGGAFAAASIAVGIRALLPPERTR